MSCHSSAGVVSGRSAQCSTVSMQVNYIQQKIKKYVHKWTHVSHFVEVSTVDAYQVWSAPPVPSKSFFAHLVPPPPSIQ